MQVRDSRDVLADTTRILRRRDLDRRHGAARAGRGEQQVDIIMLTHQTREKR